MQKKLLLFIILVSFVFYSCLDYSLPEKIELEVEGSINLPVKTSTSNWASALIKSLGDNFPEGVEIYNINYGSRQEVQSFCVYVPLDISYSLNPSEYLEEVASALSKIDSEAALEIDEEIAISSLDDFSFSCQIDQLLPVSPSEITVPIELPPILFDNPLPADVIESNFLHAGIVAGNFTKTLVNSGGNVILPDNAIVVEIKQGYKDGYDGLSASTSDGPSLTDNDINKDSIKTTVTITLRPGAVQLIDPTEPPLLKAQLNVSIELLKYNLDWKISSISSDMTAAPLSLEDVGKNLISINFNDCDVTGEDKEPAEGIGINMQFEKFSDKLISKLEMSIKCPEINMSGAYKTLKNPKNNVFGNEDYLSLIVDEDDPNKVDKLEFDIDIRPIGGSEILQLEGLEKGEALSMKGKALLFPKWTEAVVNMEKAIKGRPEAGDSLDQSGEFPNNSSNNSDNKDKIDLSIINQYIEGFDFTDVTANIYLSGPNGALGQIESPPGLEVDALYNYNEVAGEYESLSILKRGPDGTPPLKLEKNHVFLKNNPVFLDKTGEGVTGSYKFQYLPGDNNTPGDAGNTIDNFDIIFKIRPNDMFFKYKITMPKTLKVYPDMFEEEGDNDIAVAIIIKVDLKMAAGDKGGKIKFPDMFNGMDDLLGRESVEENSIFTSLNVGYLRLAVDFDRAFFAGGKIFLEKDNGDYKPILFPEGIPVNGKNITININNENFEKVKKNLINPDFRLEFNPGGTITIPKNIGLTSVRIEAKGKNTLILDF